MCRKTARKVMLARPRKQTYPDKPAQAGALTPNPRSVQSEAEGGLSRNTCLKISNLNGESLSLVSLIANLSNELADIRNRASGKERSEGADPEASLAYAVDVVCLEAIHLSLDDIEPSNVQLSLNTQGAENLRIIGFHRELRAIVTELMSNSIACTKLGRISLSLDLADAQNSSRPGDFLIVRISDTGNQTIEESNVIRFTGSQPVAARFKRTIDGKSIDFAPAIALCDSVHGEFEVFENANGGVTFSVKIPVKALA